MLGLGLSLQKGISAFNAGRALVSSYIRRVTEAGGVLQNTACDAAAINELNQDRLLEPASWVLVPDGIEEDVVFAQKPTSGLGDLTFTRASDATYTDAGGVVRRSPYNLVTFSEQFNDASWTKTALTISTSATANPVNGALTAQDAIPTAASSVHRIFKLAGAISIANTWSIFAKAKGYNFITIVENGNTAASVSFNLSTGAVSTQISAVGQIQSLGNGWYRCSMIHTTLTTPRFDVYISPTDSIAAYTGDGTSGVTLFGAQAVEGTSALDYFPTTDRQNVPRIDFRNADGTLSSCGRLLLEPQRTNLVPNGLLYNSATGVAYNTTVSGSPMAGVNCARITKNEAAGTIRYANQPCSNSALTGSTAYVLSAFFKYDGVDFATTMEFNNSFQWGTTSWRQVINIASSGITLGTSTSCTSTIENWGSGWYRVSVRITTGASPTGSPVTYLLALPSTLSTGQGFLHALPQLEAGAYPTTYIPTTTAAVTRIKDDASKTGVSSIIGQSAGTIFWDVNDVTGTSTGTGNPDFAIRNTAFTNWIGITTAAFATPFRVDVRATSGTLFSYVANITRAKAAVAWSSAGAVLYVNGAQVATSAVNPNFSFDRIDMLGGTISYKTNQSALFPTRLTNDQLEVLTSEGYGTYALLAQSLNYVLQ